jgi:phytoene dehydrogenase-like protein
MPDAIVVGAGPNGLAAAIEIARAGRSVTVFEAEPTVGGGCRSAHLTRSGFVHDVCSAFHPLASASPFLRSVPLERLGVRLIHPDVPLAHPLDDGSVAVLKRSVDETAQAFGADGRAYRRLFGPLVRNAEGLIEDLLAPLPLPPRHPFAMARFGLKGFRSALGLVNGAFRTETPKVLVAGVAAHAMQPLDRPPTAAVGLMLSMLGHAVGWPLVEGGSQKLADALAEYLKELGGEIHTGERIESIARLPDARAVLLDLTPRQVVTLASDELPRRYLERLRRYRYGPGVFKMDWALDGPIPWKSPECERAGTVHLGGSVGEIARSERDAWEGRISAPPYVLIGQQSLFDSTRAPAGQHTVWAYCHVPHGSGADMTDAIEAQVERFAPGFKDLVLERNVMGPAGVEAHNANCVGGDINGGVQDLRQLFTRPVARLNPYTTPNDGLFLCSSSTPPGGGVHGMCGHFAARAALHRTLR